MKDGRAIMIDELINRYFSQKFDVVKDMPTKQHHFLKKLISRITNNSLKLSAPSDGLEQQEGNI